jgi:hypothetical protein
MISKAHINVLPSYTHSGMKVKLLNALTNGKHCVANRATLDGTALATVCHEANTAEEFQTTIERLFEKPFSSKELKQRQVLIHNQFNNHRNALKQMQWIWGK